MTRPPDERGSWKALFEGLAETADFSGEGQRNAADWTELRRRVLLLARHFLRLQSADDADDITQTVLVKLQDTEVLRDLRSQEHPGAYVVRMVHNATIDLIRRQSRERASLERLERERPREHSVSSHLDRRTAALERE